MLLIVATIGYFLWTIFSKLESKPSSSVKVFTDAEKAEYEAAFQLTEAEFASIKIQSK